MRQSKSALEYAVGLLSKRAYSVKELEGKLHQKEYPEQEARSAVEMCLARGYLNDRMYAESLCESAAARGSGRQRILMKLRMKGIDPETAQEIVSAHAQESPEKDEALRTLKTRWNTLLREPDVRKRREKALRFLAGRGFSPDAAYSALDQMFADQRD